MKIYNTTGVSSQLFPFQSGGPGGGEMAPQEGAGDGHTDMLASPPPGPPDRAAALTAISGAPNPSPPGGGGGGSQLRPLAAPNFNGRTATHELLAALYGWEENYPERDNLMLERFRCQHLPTSLAQSTLPFAANEAPTDLAQQPIPFRSLSDTWADWLETIGERSGSGWPLFVTLTFANSVHPEAAEKAFRYWFRGIELKLFSRRDLNRGKGLTYVLATERQERGAIHIHALIGGDERLATMNKNDLARDWWDQGVTTSFELTGDNQYHKTGIARVMGPKCDEAVRRYVAKYVTKTGEGMEIHVPARLRKTWEQRRCLRFIPTA